MTLPQDDQLRRARAHTFATAAAAVIAVGAVRLFGWPAGVGMALVAVGNLLAARHVRTHGDAGSTAWAVMAVGGLSFLVVVVLAVLSVAAR